MVISPCGLPTIAFERSLGVLTISCDSESRVAESTCLAASQREKGLYEISVYIFETRGYIKSFQLNRGIMNDFLEFKQILRG